MYTVATTTQKHLSVKQALRQETDRGQSPPEGVMACHKGGKLSVQIAASCVIGHLMPPDTATAE